VLRNFDDNAAKDKDLKASESFAISPHSSRQTQKGFTSLLAERAGKFESRRRRLSNNLTL